MSKSELIDDNKQCEEQFEDDVSKASINPTYNKSSEGIPEPTVLWTVENEM